MTDDTTIRSIKNEVLTVDEKQIGLRDASVQEIQLELIRRRSFNTFDGSTIFASLQRHRDLWMAAWMTRLGFVADAKGLSSMSLIPLRDLVFDRWNVDDLYLLCKNLDNAKRLVSIAEEENWLADNVQIHQDDEASSALGTSRTDGKVVSFWWD